MTVIEQVEVKLEPADLTRILTPKQHEPVERSVGVHQSDIIKYLAKKFNMWASEDDADEMPLRILLGFAFEEYAARLYEGLWWQPGEYVLDDGMGPPVYVNPDGIEGVEQGDGYHLWSVHEFKYSGKSMRVKGGKPDELKDIRTEWAWMMQLQAGLNSIRQVGLQGNRGVLHVCWKYGNYDRPYTEKYMRYVVEYEESELEGNLAMIYGHREEVAHAK